MARAALVVIAIMAGSGVAAAQQVATIQDGDAELAAENPKSATVSISPVHLYFTMLEAEAELKAAPHVGIGLILAGGRTSDLNNNVTGTGYKAGLQINWYAFAAFSGAHLGVEGMYLAIRDVMDEPYAKASGFSLGSYLGYKLQAGGGFALIAQGGVQYIAATGSTSTRLIRDTAIAPLLNLNVGWSF